MLKFVLFLVLAKVLGVKGDSSELNGSLPLTDICGRKPLSSRVVGGMDASEGYWPWMASLQEGGSHFCGGTLIQKFWVLTAAQCVSGKDPKNLEVYLGKLTLEGINPHEIKRRVLKIHPHPSYNSQTMENDIALLRLQKKVTFTEYIHPVCLASRDSVFPLYGYSWFAGWGDIDVNVPLPSPGVLKYTFNYFYLNSLCATLLAPHLITDNMLCVGDVYGGFDVCKKDEGGPLMAEENGVWALVGVISWYQPCGLPNSPAVYTRVPNYQDWIMEITADQQPGFFTYNVTTP